MLDPATCAAARSAAGAGGQKQRTRGFGKSPHNKHFKGGISIHYKTHMILAGEIPSWEAAASATKGKDKSAIGAGDKDRFQDRGTPMATISHAGQAMTQ